MLLVVASAGLELDVGVDIDSDLADICFRVALAQVELEARQGFLTGFVLIL